jgi:RNA polymerase sigma-70 factor (ECF subfamily)
MATLPEGDQEVLRLAAWESLSHGEIGLVLGITPNAAAIRLHRARRRLEGVLKGSASTRTFMGWRGSVSSTESGEESQ